MFGPGVARAERDQRGANNEQHGTIARHKKNQQQTGNDNVPSAECRAVPPDRVIATRDERLIASAVCSTRVALRSVAQTLPRYCWVGQEFSPLSITFREAYLHCIFGFCILLSVVLRRRDGRRRQDASLHGQVVPLPHDSDGLVEVSSGHRR